MIKFEETSIPQTFSVLQAGKGYTVGANEVHFLAETYIMGISDFCKLVQNKTQPCVVEIQDLKGQFVFAAIISYNDEASEDEELGGNWNYTFTFNKADLPENSTVYQLSNAQVVDTISRRGFDHCRLTFTEPGFCLEEAIDLFNVIKDYLTQNAPQSEGDSYEIELEGMFQAGVSIENGEMVYYILPKGEMKSLVNSHEANDK